jgi:NADPH-dependent 2,4-dienoyl-CoA reductase/sulfur reductase-like enzyme
LVSRKVDIIGAGPAGIQMALDAASRGHRVTLWEKSDSIGGRVRTAARLPFKHTLPRLLRYYETALAQAGVILHLGKEAHAADLAGDVIVLATGATWQPPPEISAQATIPVLGVDDAIAALGQLGPRILVAGGGLVGMELAWALSSRCSVVIAERDADYDDDANLHARLVLIPALAKSRVEVRFFAEVEQVDGLTAVMMTAGKKTSEAFDAVIWTPRRHDIGPLGAVSGSKVIAIGECSGARGLLESTASAYRAAISL